MNCFRCQKDIRKIPGGIGNVTASGSPWCGCPPKPANDAPPPRIATTDEGVDMASATESQLAERVGGGLNRGLASDRCCDLLDRQPAQVRFAASPLVERGIGDADFLGHLADATFADKLEKPLTEGWFVHAFIIPVSKLLDKCNRIGYNGVCDVGMHPASEGANAMRFKHTSKYPVDEVEALVKFAARGVRDAGVEVHIKNGNGGGMAYSYIPTIANVAETSTRLVSIRMPDPVPAAFINVYRLKRVDARYPSGFPFEGWKDYLVYLAAHEFRHIWQFQRSKRSGLRGKGEYDAEMFGLRRLNEYREHTGRVAIPEAKLPNPFTMRAAAMPAPKRYRWSLSYMNERGAGCAESYPVEAEAMARVAAIVASGRRVSIERH